MGLGYYTTQVQRALEAARSTTCELGLHVDDAVVIHNSDRITVRLLPCDVLARIAPQAWQDGLHFEIKVARRLAETDSPIGALEPRVEDRVYVRDTFALTLWTYYEQVGAIAPADYADALFRLHAGLRRIDLAAPHISERVAAWAAEVDDPEQNPELPGPDRELLSAAFNRLREQARHRCGYCLEYTSATVYAKSSASSSRLIEAAATRPAPAATIACCIIVAASPAA